MAMSLGLFSTCIGLYFWIGDNRKLSLFAFFCALMGGVGSILSASRGGWIGLPFVLFITLYIYRHKLSKFFIPSLFSITSIFIIFASLVNIGGVSDRMKIAKISIEQYINNENVSTSIGVRLDMWKASWIAIQEKPILGWGKQGMYDKKQELASKQEISKLASTFIHNHNQFIDATAKKGLVGLVSLLLVFIIPLRFFISNLKLENINLLCFSCLGIIHVISVMFYCFSQDFLWS
ncbi:O-antigen ligase family protein [Avibacterium avium]|uniref:O-antigen ligase family protein n=1 Tax=Avibacterium avium TaxID=751 RepID=UPI003BF85DF2